MNFRPFAGTHVRITEQEAIPPAKNRAFPKTLTFTFFVVKVGTQNDGLKCKTTCFPFFAGVARLA